MRNKKPPNRFTPNESSSSSMEPDASSSSDEGRFEIQEAPTLPRSLKKLKNSSSKAVKGKKESKVEKQLTTNGKRFFCTK